MFQSKALKLTEKQHSKLYLWWIDSKIGDFYYKIKHAICLPFIHTKKMWQWYKNVFRKDYDFDGHCLFAIIEYKLRRVRKALKNGCAVHTDEEMRALDLAIKLAERLKEDNYDMDAYDRHEEKWGELHTWFTPCEDNPEYFKWNSSRPKAVTEQEKIQERQELLEGSRGAYQKAKREERWLYDILYKYLNRWWD